MCKCINIEKQTYKRQTGLYIPEKGHIMSDYINKRAKEGLNKDRVIGVDTCLVGEIADLWFNGIRTTGCCCGHNKLEGYIGVFFEDIPKMKKLGYKVAYNSSRPKDEDSFIPKSI